MRSIEKFEVSNNNSGLYHPAGPKILTMDGIVEI